MKKLIFSILMAGLCLETFGQSDIDALRYSQNFSPITARSAAVGGAFGSLGADFSSTQINPAGLALYRSNGFVFSGMMTNAKSKATYLETTKKDYDFSLGIPSVGFIFSNNKYVKSKPATKGWVTSNFVLGITRTNNFNTVVNYSGTNMENSMLDYFAERANGLTVAQLSPTSEELAEGYQDIETMMWDGYLIDSVGPKTYGAAIDPFNYNLRQKNVIASSGGTHDFNVHLAANYENRFYIGGGLLVTSVRYKEKNRFTETDESTNYENWATWTLEQDLLTKGVGVSGNIGFIFKMKENIRVGASLRTPTIYSLRDEYADQVTVSFDDGASSEFNSADGYYEYSVVTPLKTTLSGSYLFGKSGFISTDVDIIDYSTMRLRPTNRAFEVANDLISEKYGSAVNVRIGGEYVVNILRVRAGFARNGSPLQTVKEDNLTQYLGTIGIGVKDPKWSLDLAVMQQFGKNKIQPYTLNQGVVPVATSNFRGNSLMLTLATKF